MTKRKETVYTIQSDNMINMYEDRRLLYIHSMKYHTFSLNVTCINFVFLKDENLKKNIKKKRNTRQMVKKAGWSVN